MIPVNTPFCLTLVQNSSYREQAIRQRSKRMRTLWSSRATAASPDPSWGCAMTSDPSGAAWFGSKRGDNGVKTADVSEVHTYKWDDRIKGDIWRELHRVVTLVGIFGVLVQLTNLPVQVGVPGPQLETVEWLDVEVRPFDLKMEREDIKWAFIVGELSATCTTLKRLTWRTFTEIVKKNQTLLTI